MKKKLLLFIIPAAVLIVIAAAGIIARLSHNREQQEYLNGVIEKYENMEIPQATEEPVYEKYTVITEGQASLLDKPSETDGAELAKISSGSIVEFMNEITDGYFKVRLIGSTIEGYLPAYTLKSAFSYSLSDLTIVDTNSANYTFTEFEGDLSQLEEKYGSHMSYSSLTDTPGGNKVYDIIVGNKDADRHILLMSGVRGAEYMGTLLLMKQLEYYLEYYDTGFFNDINYSDVFDNIAFHIVPMLNPDGVMISQGGIDGIDDEAASERLREIYRQDRLSGRTSALENSYFKTWGANFDGVDLYHNFDRREEGSEIIDRPSSTGYAGDSDAPETAAIKQLLEQYNFIGSMCYYTTGSDIVLRYDPDIASSLDAAQMAIALANLMVYDVTSEPDDEIVAGSFTNWSTFHEGIPGIIVRIGDGAAPVSLDELQLIWLKNREAWIALASVFMTEE